MYILENIHIREEYFKKRGNTTDMLQFTILRHLGLKASYSVCVCVYLCTQTHIHRLFDLKLYSAMQFVIFRFFYFLTLNKAFIQTVEVVHRTAVIIYSSRVCLQLQY